VTRLFLPPEKLKSKKILITGEQARYLSLVMRSRPGDRLLLFDGLGFKYECTIISVHKKEVLAELIKKSPHSVESPVSITLVQGLPKADKMDLIVQKTTELGVTKIIPVITERSQVRHTDKTERWKKIAQSASQQSGRDKVPEIGDPVTFKDFLEVYITPLAKGYIEDIKGIKLDSRIHMIFSEDRKSSNLKQALSGLRSMTDIMIVIGPEGGFTNEEVDAASERGFVPVSLGPRILRTETAPLAAVSIVQYELGDMG
jgi:16S rRNA (uracil1498-N3)-methyltransferase